MTKLYVKAGVWLGKIVCVTKWCVQDGVCESCVWKRACDKVVCERGRVTKLCGKDGVWQSGVWKMVWRKMVCDKVVLKMVWWKMVCDKVVCERWCGERWCVTKWCVKDGVVKAGARQSVVWKMVWKDALSRCVKDGVWQSGVWKMVCGSWCETKCCVKDGVKKWSVTVCERWRVTKWCVEDGVWKMVCDKVVCDKAVCQRWYVTKWCVKDGVWQCDVWKMVCDNVMCERWCVTKRCVKDGMWQSGVWKMVCDNVMCERWCMKGGVWQRGVWKMVCDKVGVWKMVCDKVGVWQSCVWKMACDKVGVWKMVCERWSVTLCERWCVTKRCGRWCVKDGVWQMVCDKRKVHVSKCHTCHVKRRWMSPSSTPATQSAAASRAPKPVQARHPVPSVPRLPGKTTVDVSLCHACHVKRRWMSGCATPATQSAAASRAPKPVQARHPVPSVPRLPRETKVDVRLCHACHTKCRGVTGAQARPSSPPSAICPTPARQNDSRCEFVPRLPRETTVDVSLCHACHAKCRGVTGAQARPSAPPNAICPTPATQNDGRCEFVPRLPRETKVDARLCHACHTKCRGVTGAQARPSAPPSAICPTPATQNDSRYDNVCGDKVCGDKSVCLQSVCW